MRWLHIITGLFGLISGAVALYAVKGGKLHRRSGMIFVYTMLIMSASGAAMAAFKPERISVVAGFLAFYLVMTALLTVRRPVESFHWLDALAIVVGLTTVLLGFKFGIEGLNNADASIDDQPALVGLIFGGIALLGIFGDVRAIKQSIKGKHRIARHLWRMCFALWIAVTSFFLGQAQVFPKPIRKFPLLVAPVLLVLIVMIYWLVRTLWTGRRKARGTD
jgi:UDP-N-acetylmuramyl pentapeptide phosphotransferase/UDP-N-acetylglucosamine-1-phosphate transferase